MMSVLVDKTASTSPSVAVVNPDLTTTAGDQPPQQGKENLQGPHDWRKRLKPVSRQSSEERVCAPGERPGEDGQDAGDALTTRPHDAEVEKGTTTDRPNWREGSKVKERPKGPWKKDLVSKRIKAFKAAGYQTPSVVTCAPSGAGPAAQGTAAMPSSGHKRKQQTLAPTESAFTRQVVNKPTSPGLARRKVHHVIPHVTTHPARGPAWDKRPGVQSMVAGAGRRGATSAQTAELSGAAAKRRVEKVLKARLYLLQQNGPNSFLIGGDSPDHKYRVIIGPQRCSCGRGAFCVHVMFVMLRVFQISENDPSLWSKTLKNYEVETLFHIFHERRSSLIQNLSRRKRKALKEEVDTEKGDDTSSQATTSTDINDEADTKEDHDEEDTCPICLLEMVEGESLTECVNGCQNKLHHHCIAVWFEECRRQNEPLMCPLCRATWKVDEEHLEGSAGSELPAPPNTRVSSPAHEVLPLSQHEVLLPDAEPIPEEHRHTAEPWIPVLGEDLVACFFSKNWTVREVAVKQLGGVAVGVLLLGVGEGRTGVVLSADRQVATRQMLEACCSVLAYVCADPVYKVFVATLRTLRTLLAYTPCRDAAQQARLNALLVPVIDSILRKCADSNKRTSQLSMSAMQELMRGQEGELSVGREIVNPGELGLGGLSYLLSCVTQLYDSLSVQYQWLLGRLSFLHKLLEEHSSEFLLKAPATDLAEKQCLLEEYENYDRVMSVLRFTRGALENPHTKVARMGRQVFYQIARLQSHNAAALKHVTDLLDTLGLNIQVQLKRRLLARMTTDFHFTQHASKWLEATERGGGGCNGEMEAGTTAELLLNTPLQSESGSPPPARPSPLGSASTSVTPPQIAVTVNNFVSSNLNFVPMAPPNSPERRRGPEGRSRSGTETDSLTSGPASNVDTADCFDPAAFGDLYAASTPQKVRQRVPDELTRDLAAAALVADTLTDRRERVRSGINVSLSTCLSGESYTEETEMPGVTVLNNSSRDEEDEEEHADEREDEEEEELNVPNGVCGADLSASLEEEEEEEEEEAVHNTTMDSTVHALSVDADCTGPGPCRATSYSHPSTASGSASGSGSGDAASSVSSTDATAASGSTGMLSEDLSDSTSSPSGADFHISFKTEVATASPSATPARRPPIVVQPRPAAGGDCPCKEEVEREEAQALVAALEQSELLQNPLPYIPGLSGQSPDAAITILVQEDSERPNGERTILDPMQPHTAARGAEGGDYREGEHWVRGPMLGTGAFSTCYQARDTKTGALVAVKQISFCRNSVTEQEEVMECVREEIQMMSRLNHPNVVRILGATQQASHFFMFVEWMPGGSVAYLLDRYGAFCEGVIIKYTQQVLRGLAYLHDSHVLHRDLKGANLLVDSTGERVRIADFGASARLSSRQTGAGEFQGQLLGTIAFMAPEVLRGENYGRSCDVWSVGCTVIEMATTKPPWGAGDLSNHLALIFKIASAANAPPVPETLSPAVRDLVKRCLECRREDRPPAKELLKHPLFTLLQRS